MLLSLPYLNLRIRNKVPSPSVYNSHKQGYEDYCLEIISVRLWQGLVLEYLRVVTLENVKNKLLLLEFFSYKLLSLR